MNSISPWIFATDACNLRCPYCFEEHKNNVMSEEVWSALSEHFIKLTNDEVIDHSHFRISGGEPFTCFDSWREFPIYLKKVLGDKFGAGVITNFTLLNDEILKYLVDNNIGCGVSLDGTIHSKDIAKLIPGSTYISDFGEIEKYLKENIEEGDIVITMGAGDINKVGKNLVSDCK